VTKKAGMEAGGRLCLYLIVQTSSNRKPVYDYEVVDILLV
jgi:hypothetical protein